MSTKTVDLSDAQSHLPELLSLALSGTEVIIAEDGMPRARLVPVAPDLPQRIPDLHQGAIWTSDDFDAPLPEEFWTGSP